MSITSKEVEQELESMNNKSFPFDAAEVSRCPHCNYTGAKAFHVKNKEIYFQCEVCYGIFKKILK